MAIEFMYRGSLVALGSLSALLLVYAHQHTIGFSTPVSRLDLLHSLIAEGVVCIDRYHTNTPDKAIFQGHYYSDKAPGTVVVALPGFALAAYGGQAAGVELESELGWLLTSWAACAWSQALPAAIGAGMLYAWLAGWVSRRASLITVAALIFGAAPLPYATMLFSHTMVVGLLCLAVWLIAQVTGDTGGRAHSPKAEVPAPVPGHDKTFPSPAAWLAPLAGFSVGLALASEYTAGPVVVGLTVLLALGRRSALLPFCLGAAPPLLLIPAYSYACLGDPFILPYSLQACFPAMREGLYAIKWPDAETAFNLLFSPTRGLFFWTPFLLMAGFGYGELARRSPQWFWLTYVIPLLQILIISGRVWDWQAGPTLGPRYLAPILPLLALPCALGVQRWPKLGLALAAYSVAITTLATLTDACPPGHVYNPLIEIHIPAFLKADFSPNLGMLLGLPPYVSVAVFYAILVGGLGWIWRQLPA